MAGSEWDVLNAGSNGLMDRDNLKYSEMNEVYIKYCKHCGYTKRLPYRKFDCPECESFTMFFFTSLEHFIRYIDLYGLGNIRIADEAVRQEVLRAFT